MYPYRAISMNRSVDLESLLQCGNITPVQCNIKLFVLSMFVVSKPQGVSYNHAVWLFVDISKYGA
jgi:hypothetical protein